MPQTTIKDSDWFYGNGPSFSVNPVAAQWDLVLVIAYVPALYGAAPTLPSAEWQQVYTSVVSEGKRMDVFAANVLVPGPYTFTYTGATDAVSVYGITTEFMLDLAPIDGTSLSQRRGPSEAPTITGTLIEGRIFYVAPTEFLQTYDNPINVGPLSLTKVNIADGVEELQIYSSPLAGAVPSGDTDNNSNTGGGNVDAVGMHIWIPPTPQFETIQPSGVLNPQGAVVFLAPAPPMDGAIGPSGEVSSVIASTEQAGAIAPTGEVSFISLEPIKIDGSITPFASLLLTPSTEMEGEIGPSGSLFVDSAGVLIEGAISPQGSLRLQVLQELLADGQIGPIGELNLIPLLDFDGEITPESETDVSANQVLDSQISFDRGLVLLPDVRLEGEIPLVSETVGFQADRELLDGEITFDSKISLVPMVTYNALILMWGLVDYGILIDLDGAITPVGDLSPVPPKVVDIEGVIEPIGELTLQPDADLYDAFITPIGEIDIEPQIVYEGSLAPEGELTLTVLVDTDGSLTPVGDSTVVVAGTIHLQGEISPVGDTIYEVPLEFEGSLNPVGDFYVEVPLEFEGAITPSGTVAGVDLRILKLNSVLTLNGEVVTQPDIPLEGFIGPASDLHLMAGANLEGAIAPIGELVTEDASGLKFRAVKFKDFTKQVIKRMQR